MIEPMIIPYKGVRPKIHPTAFIAPNAVIIGDVEIGAYASIWFGVVIRGDVNYIRIGERTNVQDGTVIHAVEGDETTEPMPTLIGDDVTIGHQALLHGCTVESRVLIGTQSSVMDGAYVETGSFVAASAMITPGKRVKTGEIWAGVPAKMWRTLSPEHQATIEIRAAQYVRLAESYK